MDGCLSGPKKILAELRADWRRASVRQLNWVLADSDSDNSHVVNYADEVQGQRVVCRAFGKAPHVPIWDLNCIDA